MTFDIGWAWPALACTYLAQTEVIASVCSMSSHFLLLMLFFYGSYESLATNPGFRIAITSKGLDYSKYLSIITMARQ